MKKLWMAALILLTVAFSVSAEVKTVPGPLLAWYKDAMDMYTTLIASLDKVKDAPATAAAFQQAATTVKAKNLGPRYRELKKQYPDFFKHADGEATAWVPPADWIKVSQDYSKAMANYGQSMQKAAPFMGDPAVRKALKDFAGAMKEMSGSDDEE